jgi:hypothetical protein
MDSPVSPKDDIWFLRVCHHISNTVYLVFTAVSLVSNINLQEGKWDLWNDAENSGFAWDKTVK